MKKDICHVEGCYIKEYSKELCRGHWLDEREGRPYRPTQRTCQTCGKILTDLYRTRRYCSTCSPLSTPEKLRAYNAGKMREIYAKRRPEMLEAAARYRDTHREQVREVNRKSRERRRTHTCAVCGVTKLASHVPFGATWTCRDCLHPRTMRACLYCEKPIPRWLKDDERGSRRRGLCDSCERIRDQFLEEVDVSAERIRQLMKLKLAEAKTEHRQMTKIEALLAVQWDRRNGIVPHVHRATQSMDGYKQFGVEIERPRRTRGVEPEPDPEKIERFHKALERLGYLLERK